MRTKVDRTPWVAAAAAVCVVTLLTPAAADMSASLPADPSDGEALLLYYSFDRDNGRTVADDSGNGHAGTVCGALFTPNGKVGGAYVFDGEDDHIVGGRIGPLAAGSICFWMNAAELGDWRNPLSTDYASWDDCFRFEESATGEFVFGALGFGSAHFTQSLEAGRWYHVILTWDGEATRGYLNGDLCFTVPYPAPDASVHPAIPNGAGYWRERSAELANIAVGNGYSTDPGRHWKGLIDEVRIYGRAIRPEEAAVLAGDLGAHPVRGTEPASEPPAPPGTGTPPDEEDNSLSTTRAAAPSS